MARTRQTRRKRLEGQAVSAWRKAGAALGIRVESPFLFRAGQDERQCIAYLPDFGGPKGILVVATTPPGFQTDPGFDSAARAAGYYFSYLNIEEYADFDEESFREALCDWGFYGKDTTRPEWLK